MKITPIPFAGVRAPKDAPDLRTRPGLSYSAAIELPKPAYLFDDYHNYISIGRYGQILPGGWHLEQAKILDSIDDYNGPILLPFGEPMTLVTCDTWVKLFQQEDTTVLDFNVKDARKRSRFMFQVHFPLSESNIVEYHYYHVQTGYRTLIGAKAQNGEWVEWSNMRADYPYSKVALRVDCSLNAPVAADPDKDTELQPTPTRDVSKKPTAPARPGYEWRKYNTPMGDVWKEVKLPQGEGWSTVWQDDRYRLQKLV